ncbi:MAG: LytTR family DNA-binding domain-containing protein [Bacteroidales bacterium]|jgi:two-component system LytT family response regulator
MDGKIKTVIIEDEQKSMLTLQTLLERYCPEIEVIGTGSNVETGLRVLEELRPELVFLDIAMPDGDAFDLLNRIGRVDFEIIFITAYNDFALKAFEFSALHYLLKPINYKELQDAVQRYEKIRPSNNIHSRLDVLNSSLKNHFDKISLPSNDGLIIVEIQDIVRFEAAGNYSTVYLSNNENIIVTKTLNQFEEILSGLYFVRIHNTHIINLRFVKRYQRGQGGTVTLNNGTELAVSRARKYEFIEGLKNLSLTMGNSI